MMKRYWAAVQQMQEQLGDVVVLLFFAVAITLLQPLLLRVSWRNLTAAAAVLGCAGSWVIGSVTALGYYRNQYFFLVQDLFLQTPRAVNYLVGTWVTAELSPPGLEATVYGVVASLHSLAPVLARALANPLYAWLPTTTAHLPAGSLSAEENYTNESRPFTLTVAISVWVGSGLIGLTAMLVGLLPADAASARTGQVMSQSRSVYCCGWWVMPHTCNGVRWYVGVATCVTLFCLGIMGTLTALLS